MYVIPCDIVLIGILELKAIVYVELWKSYKSDVLDI